MKPILVHIHIFYPDKWAELKECLKSLDGYPYDLYVTFAEKNLDIEADIKNLKPDANILMVKNKGYDIAPFLQVINGLSLDKYDYIIKLHTKRDVKETDWLNGFDISGAVWRDYLLRFIKKRDVFIKVLETFGADNTLGLSADWHLIVKKDLSRQVNLKAREMAADMGLSVNSFSFVAGSMFIARASIFKSLQNLWNVSDFETCKSGVADGTLAHILERLFGLAVVAGGFKIYDASLNKRQRSVVAYLVAVSGFYRYRLLPFLYVDKITKSNKRLIKICKIPVWSKRIKS